MCVPTWCWLQVNSVLNYPVRKLSESDTARLRKVRFLRMVEQEEWRTRPGEDRGQVGQGRAQGLGGMGGVGVEDRGHLASAPPARTLHPPPLSAPCIPPPCAHLASAPPARTLHPPPLPAPCIRPPWAGFRA